MRSLPKLCDKVMFPSTYILDHLSHLADHQPIHLLVLGVGGVIQSGSERLSDIHIHNDMRIMFQFEVELFDLAVGTWTSSGLNSLATLYQLTLHDGH